MSELLLKGIIKEFQSGADSVFRAVDQVSAEMDRGEFVTLLGPSGCGKTTILRMVAGFETPTAGEILLGSQRLNELPPEKRDTSMVFQSYALFPHYSVFDNVAFGLQIKKLSGEAVTKKVLEALSMVGLRDLGNRLPNQLSGGQQQRVALARALVMEPRILLFDEPLSNLDAKLRVHMRREIRKIQKTLGLTSIYVTHDQAEALSLSDKVIVMNKGKIEQVGTPTEIYQRPATEFVAAFIGNANFLPATIKGVESGSVYIDILGQVHPVKVKDPGRFSAGEEVKAVLRPEAVDLGGQGEYDGLVKLSTFIGSVQEYVVSVGNLELYVEQSNPFGKHVYTEGERVKVSFGLESLHIIKTGEKGGSL